MEEKLDIVERVSRVQLMRSFRDAFRGIFVFVKVTPNALLHTFALVAVVFLGSYCGITRMEWIVHVFAIGFVFMAEAFNTAIEIDINLTSPEYHPYAKDTKDVAASAVLIAALTALTIGVLVFAPYLI